MKHLIEDRTEVSDALAARDDSPTLLVTMTLQQLEASMSLPKPRIVLSSLPEDIRSMCVDSTFERVFHSRGRDFIDLILNMASVFTQCHDLVAYPSTESEALSLRKCYLDSAIQLCSVLTNCSILFASVRFCDATASRPFHLEADQVLSLGYPHPLINRSTLGPWLST